MWPASAKQQVVMWELQLSKIKAAEQSVSGGADAPVELRSSVQVLQGEAMQLFLRCARRTGDGAVVLVPGFRTPNLVPTAVHRISLRLVWETMPGGQRDIAAFQAQMFSHATNEWTYHDLFGYTIAHTWATAEAFLRSSGYVAVGECLHLTAEIKGTF